MATTKEHVADAARKQKKREAGRIVTVPACEDRDRRASLEADDIAWLMWYFGEGSGAESPFTYQFTSQQREMIAAIRDCIIGGHDQSLAASRGEGKTTLFERMLLKYTLQGEVNFSVLFAATGSAAQDSLDSIKSELENNDRLYADYPEVCAPVRALEGVPQKAHSLLVQGERHDNGKPYGPVSAKFTWSGQEIYLPKVPGSPASEAIIATRGLDAAVRGLKKKGRRVRVAGIDDPDTEETARSEDQAKKLIKRIDRGIAGLGSQNQRVARVMLTTLQSRISASYTYTDEKQKPSWKPKRFRFLVKPPNNGAHWEEYIRLKQTDWIKGTNTAHEYYLANREAMDDGAEVANPNRYTKNEASALEFYHSEIARIGPEAVATEYDNDPPEETGPVESGITSHRIQRQLSGHARGVVPPGTKLLTQGIDVKKSSLHWVVRAWQEDGSGSTIAYGIHEVHGTIYGSEEGVELAIKKAILARLEETPEYMSPDGELFKVELTLVDSGWMPEAVYAACQTAGLGVMPIKGQPNFHDVQKRTVDRQPGIGYFLSRQHQYNGLWLVNSDPDYWKTWEHARWMTAPGNAGCMTIFGQVAGGERLSNDEKAHHAYAHHITAEVEVEEAIKGTLKRYFKKKSDNNHWLDASCYADVAAAIKGIRLFAPHADAKAPIKLSDIQAAKRKQRKR